MTKDWFASWFDSPYYHLLYKNRDEEEAEKFILTLVKHLELETNTKVLDLACGKGRHAKTLHKAGLDVLGVDLSPNSIASASEHTTEGLKFAVHDMRETITDQKFKTVFNLFTSFGYFDDNSENLRMLESIHNMLEENGLLVIDFMNANKVIENIVEEEVKIVEQVHFNISRNYDGNHIFKTISFCAEGRNQKHTERVQAIKFNDFESLLSLSKFEILRTFGDFDLNDFSEETSDRLIIIAQKK
ncbi:MAG: class I SAM-dependent methyltransferase [Flavobacteriales bacterium]|nr:class I SAM-dependent methyltransferase [Flavobacteriales bacterium]